MVNLEKETTAETTEGMMANSGDSGMGASGSSSGEHSGDSRKDEQPMMMMMENASAPNAATEVGAVKGQQEAPVSDANAVPPPPIRCSPAKSASGSNVFFNSVMGYARARLFNSRNANDGTAASGDHPPPPSSTSSSIVGRPQAIIGQIQSAQGTPTKKWSAAAGGNNPIEREGSNKSCPVTRRQWSYSAQQNDSYSLATSRECVVEEAEEDARSVRTIGVDQSLYSSRRTSWQQRNNISNNGADKDNKQHWQLFAITLQKATQSGFGIAISGGPGPDAAILVSDVIQTGPAFGLLQVGDRIISVNGYPLEHADYASAIAVMKDAQQLNMIVKRRVPVPFVEFEQRTLKFTLSKSRKKDDFGIVLGCKFFIKEILNPKLAEKEPGLKEGDTVLRVNGQALDGMTLDEAARMLHRSREKLSLVVQRDVRRGQAEGVPGNGGRWPSQTTVYERLGSVQATPRQSPSPARYGYHPMSEGGGGQYYRKASPSAYPEGASGYKRFSDPMTAAGPQVVPSGVVVPHYAHPPPFPPAYGQQPQQMMMMMSNNGREMSASGLSQQSQHSCPSPYMHHQQQQQRMAINASPGGRPQSQTPQSSVHSLNNSSISANPPTGTEQPSPFVNDHQQQQRYLSYQPPQQAHHHNHQQHPAPSSSSTFQQQPRMIAGGGPGPRQIHQLAFHKGPGGLGIRVIGGDQAGIFVSAVQDHSPAHQHGIRVGDRIHAVNGTSMVGVTREEAFEFLLSLGEQQICMAVERAADEYAQIVAGKCGDSFYVRTHFAHKPERAGGRVQGQPELAFLAGDIFHVTDTLYGGSPGCWQVTKVYSAADAEPKGGVIEPGSGLIPHARAAEMLMRKQKQAERTAVGGGMDGNGAEGAAGMTLFRKKLTLSSRKLFGGGNGGADQSAEDVLSGGSGTGNYAAELVAPAYERVALKRPAFHRPVVLYGPLADVARQLLLSRFPLRFGAPLPSSSSSSGDQPPLPLSASTSSATDSPRGIPLAAVDAVMAAQKHCVLCVSTASVERLQLAQYAPIVVLIDVESRGRVRDLRSKAGAPTQSARRLMEQAQRVKRQHQHLLTATLDASKEDHWFDALRQLIFHLQERRVWMPEFQPECPLDDLLLFPMHQSGETPTSDSGGDYGVYDGALNGQQNGAGAANNTNYPYGSGKNVPTNPHNNKQQQPFMVPNPVYTLKQQQFGGALIAHHQQMSSSLGGSSPSAAEADYISSSSSRPSNLQQNSAKFSASRQSEPPPGASDSPFDPSGAPSVQHLSLYSQPPPASSGTSPREAKSQLLAQLASELGSPGPQQRV